MATQPIVIEAPEVETIDVTLVGQHYDLIPPKTAMALRLAVEIKQVKDEDPVVMMGLLDRWLDFAFGGKKKADAVRKRLEDPNDRLDVVHLVTLMEKVIEVQMPENPTS